MCGIVGLVGSQEASEALQILERMTDRHRSRGPDGVGYWQTDHASFGHCRLAVIDPTNSSDQPFVRHDLYLTIVFNGCIYNYQKLRSQLKADGYEFTSNGDTEVILCAYDKWKERCVDHFEGMFAFAVFDHKNNSLFLARDRIGIKPLYYTLHDETLIFSSTLPPLLRAMSQSVEIDKTGLCLALNYRCGVPGANTIIQGIKKVEPGTFIRFVDGVAQSEKYWSLGDFYSDEQLNLPVPVLEKQFFDLLRDAILQRTTVTDVSYGLFLSGGIDSTILLAVMREVTENVKSFSIGFNSWNDEAGDEFYYSDLAAQEFSSDHHKIFIEDDEIVSELDGCISAMSEPLMSEDAIGFYLLSRFASNHVKVVLCGQGADEILGGYSWYHRITDRGNWALLYGALRRDRSSSEYQSLVMPEFRDDNDVAQVLLEAFESQYSSLDATAKTLLADTTITLPEDPLKRVDNMTMAFGLEGRVPFCDHRLVEFCARMPSAAKVAGGIGKKILHSSCNDKLPDEIITRKKGAFPVPAITQSSPAIRQIIGDTLTSTEAKQRGIFNYQLVDKWVASPEKYLTPIMQSKLWQVFLMEKWFQINNI
ncbi:MAG: N-acetylglutaminylglutamine amidotransferase [Parvularcula sp.]|nr:N-acetylglutaminylglutamine amidotransferase [Parvularcula sp.]